MKLYLAQHAEAKKEEEDPARSLSEKGKRDLDKISNFLKGKGIKVIKIFHSGKLRAKQTAEKLSEAIDSSNGIIESDGLSPLNEPEIWFERLEEEKDDIVIIGHLPHLSKLASLLLLGYTHHEAIRFKNGGVICLEKNQERKWSIQWMVTPNILG
ncbi:MAG: phosphohistidine phosphatase SixA [Candidatus Bathyarchaeota archaeon]|nr:phosphohistidine phosphatase SixA [Candidatus Bathyarchaeota archaeon]